MVRKNQSRGSVSGDRTGGEGAGATAGAQFWDALPVPALELGPDAHALRGNRAFAAFTGLAPAQITGTGWFAALPPDRRAALFEALAGRADFHLELRLLRHDGGKAWVDLAAQWQPSREAYLCLLHDVTASRLGQQDMQAELQRFALLADNVPVLIAYFETRGFTCSYANRPYAATFGLEPRAVLGRTFAEIIGQAAADEIQPRVEAMLRQRQTVNYVRQLRTVDGALRWIDVSLVPHQVPAGGPVCGAFVLISDITRHRQAELAARESEDRLAKFMAASVEGIVFHVGGVISDANEPICRLVGLSRDELIGRRVLDFIAPQQQARSQQVMAQGAELNYETELVDALGQLIPVECIVRTLVRGGERLRMAVVRDLRDRRAVQERLRHLARHDALTGLANRAAFMGWLDAAVAERRASAGAVALLLLDLDHFRRVNDALGHRAGDAALQLVARRLAEALPQAETLGRVGGDQFAVLLRDEAAARPAALAQAQRLRLLLQAPLACEGREVGLTATLGLAGTVAEAGAEAGGSPRPEADTLLRQADAAMAAGKQAGRDTVVEYGPALAAPVDRGLRQESRLAHALERGEFALLLQPRLRVADGTLVAVQALLRWRHPQRGWLAPAEFVDLAEHRHLLQPLADWALREALLLQRRWRDERGRELSLVLDLAALHPHGLSLAHTVGRVLADLGSPPGPLVLELEERLCAEDPQRLQRLLAQLQQLGVGVMLDDFGAGGAPLALLRQLPLAGLKIAAGLVGALPGDAGAAAVVRAIITLARGLGLPLCAAGVASAAQQQWLQAEGCDQLQGPWAGAPMTADRMSEWLAARSAGTARRA